MRLHLALLLGAALAAPASASAQYALDWRSVDGGGGRLSGGAYELTGTIGQPDADLVPQCSADGGPACAGAVYVLSGGFWAGLVGAPAISCGPGLECIFRDGFENALERGRPRAARAQRPVTMTWKSLSTRTKLPLYM